MIDEEEVQIEITREAADLKSTAAAENHREVCLPLHDYDMDIEVLWPAGYVSKVTIALHNTDRHCIFHWDQYFFAVWLFIKFMNRYFIFR